MDKEKINEINEILKNNEDFLNLNKELEDELNSGYTPLTYKERIFVQEYCKHGGLQKAALTAGYSEKSTNTIANHLINKPHIKVAILKRQQALSNISIINKEWVMTELAEIVEELKFENKNDVISKLKVLDMICKLNGLYNDTTINVQNNFDSIQIQIIKKDGIEG